MDSSPKSATTVKDPVCGMNVEPSTARHKLDHAGKTYYFCSAHCLEKFRARPEDYLAVRPALGAGLHMIGIAPAPPAKNAPTRSVAVTSAGSAYVCPMCPGVRSAKPAACPSCGMALEPEMPVAATRVEYTCPMHPEIVRPGPGSCPICGMALEPRTVTAQEEDNPELRDMTRRFWISLALTAPLLVIAMGHMVPGMPMLLLASGWQPWIELLLATPVVLWGGWPFFQARLDVHRQSLHQHVHADRDGHGRGLSVQRGGDRLSANLSRFVSRDGRKASGLLRSGGGDHHPGAAGASAGTARPQPNRRGHPCVAGSLAEDGARVARWRARKTFRWSR